MIISSSNHKVFLKCFVTLLYMSFAYLFSGQITLNNQAIPGLTVNNVTGLPQAIGARSHTPTPSPQPTDPSKPSMFEKE